MFNCRKKKCSLIFIFEKKEDIVWALGKKKAKQCKLFEDVLCLKYKRIDVWLYFVEVNNIVIIVSLLSYFCYSLLRM